VGAKRELRDKQNAVDGRILAHLETLGEDEGKGVRASQLVQVLGVPWQAVAKSLRRLVGIRRVLVTEVEHQDHRYRVRRVCYYRRNLGMVATLPEWLAPRVHVVHSARLVKGRAGDG
jgi:hypothetical protein